MSTHSHSIIEIERQLIQSSADPNGVGILIRQRNFAQFRFRRGFIVALFAALVGAVVAASSFSGAECVPLYTGFQGWDGDGAVNSQFVSEAQTLGGHYQARGESFKRYMDDFWRLGEGRDIAGVARFLAVIIAGVLTVFFYRELLDEAYEAKMAPVQRKQWQAMKQTPRHTFSALAIACVVSLTIYVVTSAIWLLLAHMFEHAALNLTGAILLTALFVGVVSFVVMIHVTVLSTHRLFMLLLLNNSVGLGVMFVIAKQMIRSGDKLYWWQSALSSLGKQSGTDIMWTFGFVSLFLVLYVLWLDFAGFLSDALDTSSPIANRAPTGWLRVFGNEFKRWRFLYFFAAGCVLSVGIIPVNHATRLVYLLTFTLHTLAAVAAILIYWVGGMLLVTKRLRHVVFSPGFVTFSWVSFCIIFGVGFMLVIREFNMAVFELVVFVTCGVWLYAATDQLLWYSNLKAHETDTMYLPTVTSPHQCLTVIPQQQFAP